MRRRWRIIASVAVLMAWGASLLLPAVWTTMDAGGWAKGFALLLFGWMGFSAGQFAWLANPLLLVMALVLMVARRPYPKIQAIGGTLLLLLAGNVLYLRDPERLPILAVGPGYYLWVAAVVAAGLASLACVVIEKEAA